MDAITKAVEKARLQRQTLVEPRPAAAARPGPMEVRYDQTRSLPLAPENLRRRRIITGAEKGEFADAYKMLRTRVLQSMRANGWTTLAVTSCGPGEGKTLTSINLGIGLALEATQTVLLVDLDLRRPKVNEYLDIELGNGLSNYLLDDTPLTEILINPGIERFVVLPNAQTFANSSEMLCSPKMLHLVRELKTRYPARIVIFDMPPIFAGDDMLAFSPHVDAVLLVVEAGKAKKEELTKAAELLRHANVIGTVLNKSTETAEHHYYYYHRT